MKVKNNEFTFEKSKNFENYIFLTKKRMNSRRNENHGDDLRFSFRNTRSKFYKKKESDMDSPGDQSEK